jgi:O-antigen ligase
VFEIATLTGPLPTFGVIVVAALGSLALIAREDRRRAWLALGALVLAPILLLAAIWDSPSLSIVHRHPAEALAGAGAGLAVLAVAAVLLARHPRWMPPLAVAALPFRVPVSAGSAQPVNLLLPLYLVVGAATLGWAVATLRRETPAVVRPAPHLFERVLALSVFVYALQSTYSVDAYKALENVVFFYVPFALLFALLREARWDRELVTRCLVVTAVLAVTVAGVGFLEEATGRLLLNPKLIAANDVHPYFTVNSVFYDPDVFGRYLALVMILVVAVLIGDRRRTVQIAATVVLAILWTCLIFTLSRSSLMALLAGMAVLAAVRWRLRPVLISVAAVVVAGAVALAISPRTFGLNQGLNGASSGRANLITGGISMFGQRPLWGYGSGGFSTQYGRENRVGPGGLTASHTIPVTIAAEQGLIGLVLYIALLITSLRTLGEGVRGDALRTALLAAWLALLLHTMLYADFLEDAASWTLLAIGSALAGARRSSLELARREERRRRLEAVGASVPAA